MKLGLDRLFVLGVFLSVGLAAQACAKPLNNGIPGAGVPTGDGGTDGGGTEETEESEDDPPHAIGVITLGESHTAGSSSVNPSVSAAFLPESISEAKSCGREIDGCTLVAKADCSENGDGGISTCGTDEVCTLNESCKSVCQPIPYCSPSCDDDQVCKLVGTKSKCVAKVEFNAGVITLSGDGVTKSITLRPPYSFSTDGDSPFVPEGEITVNASGATEAGYEKFKDTFTATTFIQTTPALEKLDPVAVFEETGPVSLGWKPGSDEVSIMVTGNKGTAICKADDAEGKFDVTRKVIRQVWSDEGFSTPSLSVSISRTKAKLKKDGKTMGEVQGVELPPVGFVRFVTSSTETFTVQGCSSGYKSCASTSGTGKTCTNVMSDRYNCGDCGNTCASSQYCSSGQCY